MSTFADTSGFLALIDAGDRAHSQATAIWRQLGARQDEVYTTNYVVLETVALLHHRFGIPVVRRFVEDILPVVTAEWVDAEVHRIGLSAVMAGGRRGPSLVDCTSFEVMRRCNLSAALAFDQHFADRGYTHPSEQGTASPS